MRNILATALALALTGAVASADSITDVLSGTDSNFRFSVLHTSTGGSDGQSGTITHDISFHTAPGLLDDWDEAGVTHFHLKFTERGSGDVSLYHVDGQFDYADLRDGVWTGDQLVGHLTFSVLSGDSFLHGTRIYFEDRAYSSASHHPNQERDGLVTLWGTSNFNRNISPTAVIGQEFDLVQGGTGIDLRLQLGGQPVPEPGTLALFGLAGLGFVVYRRKRKTA